MKMLKLVFSFMFLLFIAVRPNPFQSKSSLSDVEFFMLEEPCVRQGGMCLRIEDCDPNNVAGFSNILCPKQHHLGVACCYV